MVISKFSLGFLLLSFLFFSLSGCGSSSGTVASLTVSPTSATIGIGQSQVFTAVAHDSTGKIVSVTPTWSISGGIGTISSSGLFIAGSASGEGTITAAVSGKTSSSRVTVTEYGWVSGRVTTNVGNYVQDLKVYLENTSLFTFTNSTGYYSIASVPAGTYRAWTEGTSVYTPSSQEVTLSRGETKTANFTVYYYTDPPDLNPPDFPTTE